MRSVGLFEPQLFMDQMQKREILSVVKTCGL